MIKHSALSLAVLLALAACNEDDGESGSEQSEAQSTSQAEATPPVQEDTANADDGGGAMDGATTSETANEPAAASSTSDVSQDAIDSCIDALRESAGASGGTVAGTEFSEANSLVTLADGAGATWRCLVSNDGSNASVERIGEAAGAEEASTADDGGGAMDGATSEGIPPSVGSSTDVTDFVGAPAGQAPGGLQALGFESIRSEGLTTWWFNRDTGACAQITTSDGVYSEVVMVPAEDC